MKRLVITFIALLVLAGASWISASAGAPPIVSIAIAGVKALAIALVFMELAHAHPVPRIIAVVALLFVVLLCVGTAADVSFRL